MLGRNKVPDVVKANFLPMSFVNIQAKSFIMSDICEHLRTYDV